MPVNEDIRSLQRRLDQIIDQTGEATGSTVLGNGDQALFTITTSSNSGAKVMVAADIAVYIGTAVTANQLPGGASIDESQWQVIGPWNDFESSDGINTKTLVYIRNISAGSQTVILKTASRVLINSATPSLSS